MSDLVERMRKEVVQDNFVGLLDEAAARIETLEAALRAIQDISLDDDPHAAVLAITAVARAALAPEQDK